MSATNTAAPAKKKLSPRKRAQRIRWAQYTALIVVALALALTANWPQIQKVFFDGELIKTTLPKAKELRRVAEPLITLAKVDSVANRRLAFARLRDNEAVGNLFTILGPRYANRPGGYLRLLKCGFRAGDNAPMAYVELVDRPVVAEEVAE